MLSMSYRQNNSGIQNFNQNYSSISPNSNSYRKRRNRSDSDKQEYGYEDTMAIRSDCIDMVIEKCGVERLQSYYNVRVILDKSNSTITVLGNREIDITKVLVYIREETNNPEEAFRSNIFIYNMNDDQLCSSDIKKRNEELSTKYWTKCQPLTKHFYDESPQVASLSKEEVKRIRLKNNNTNVSRISKQDVGGSVNIPNPIWIFEHCFAAYPDLMNKILKRGFKKPLPIQAQGWPILLKGENMIAASQTGTGKTLLYALPSFIHSKHTPKPCSRKPCPNILIMVPSKEVGLQIESEVNKFQFRGIRAACIYVGGYRRKHFDSIVNGADIIICTPDHLTFLHKKKSIDISKISYLVLDEVDRMLSMGLELKVRRILFKTRPDRQTVMTSASWSKDVKCFAGKCMDNFLQVCVGSLDLIAPLTVRQLFEFVKDDTKYHMITNLLAEMKPNEKFLIFCESKSRVIDLYSDLLTKDNHCCECVYDTQDIFCRERNIAYFISGEVKILVGSDYAARCIDVEDLTHVINYDFPFAIKEYVYRVGRTGRGGRKGTVISYLTSSDCEIAPELITYLEKSNQKVPYELRELANLFETQKERKRFENSARVQMKAQRSGGGGGQRNRA